MITLVPRTKAARSQGFSLVEILVACATFPLIVIGFTSAFTAIRHTYMQARQFNELYAVLSACPELDRALDYNVLSGTTNCYPNNSFVAEDTGVGINTYTPELTVTPTTDLSASDPLHAIPDAKVVKVNVNFLAPFQHAPPAELRMLISRNGLGQL